MSANQNPASQATSPDAGGQQEAEGLVSSGTRRYLVFMAVPSWLVSMVLHAVLLMVLAMITIAPPSDQNKSILTVAPSPDDAEEIEEFEEELIQPIDVQTTEVSNVSDVVMEMTSDVIPTEVTQVTVANDVDAAAIAIELSDFSEQTAPKNDLLATVGSVTGTGIEGRGSAAARQALVMQNGGNEGSEAAVANALKWLAAHQLPDGGWNFDHRIGPGVRLADHPGTLTTARNGATAMALLPFLGSGQTHIEGSYKIQVKGGLAYLMNSMKQDGSLYEGGGSMYSHGLAAIVLCESYAMTHDKALMAPAQASLNFISYAQDPVGGGWRYSPRTPGDTSVVGWQLMALKSGHMAYLQVPPNTVKGAMRFLDLVQSDSGAKYGYADPGAGSATTAIGLLCRMYLGWKQDNSALERGVQFLSNSGPSVVPNANMYYNYYGTQVMKQYGGDPWEKWNVKMRDFLVEQQAKDGPAKGSWFFGGGHGAEHGGRIYNTSLATMILEVYYRHMPIYQSKASSEEFPL